MKVPNFENAIVPEAKITKYLLSLTHSRGKSKAKFFWDCGFAVDEWQIMVDALLKHIEWYEVAHRIETPHGTNYAVEGELQTPSGRTPNVRSIWTIDAGGSIPRLVSAYPI